MGGNEAPPGQDAFQFKDLGISDDDINRFSMTGVDASALRGAKLAYSKNKSGEYDFQGVFSQNQKDIRSLVDQYSAWAEKQATSSKAHEAYLEAKLANPGRSATLLVPGEEKQGKSLIGG